MTQRNRSLPTPVLYSAALLLLVSVAGCGAGSDESAGRQGTASGLAEGAAPELELGGLVSEQEVDVARRHYELGRERWASSAPDRYTLEVRLESVGLIRLEIEGGEVRSREASAASGDPADLDSWDLPESVEGLFERVDQLIGPFEDDPGLVPDPGECGHHFNISFDTALGHPTYVDGLGPCDDGVGIRAEVLPS